MIDEHNLFALWTSLLELAALPDMAQYRILFVTAVAAAAASLAKLLG